MTVTNHTESLIDRTAHPSLYVVNPDTGEVLARPPVYLTPSERRLREYLAAAGVAALERADQVDADELRRLIEAAAFMVPAGGWPAFWRAAGQRSAPSYLEQIAKPDTFFKNEFKKAPAETIPEAFLTCAAGGLERMAEWAIQATDENGHSYAKEIVCGREWCKRCGDNATPGYRGSVAHRRRIARLLPKARQLDRIGYFVLTVPTELRVHLRSKEMLSALGVAVRRLMVRLGFDRGFRRWDWFGEKAVKGGRPVFHPHMNVVVEAGWIEPEMIERVKRGWRRILAQATGQDVPSIDVHYDFAATPGQKYHRVRYVTKATFHNWRWDEQAAGELIGFRNSQTWGKWDGEPVWEAPDVEAPDDAAAKITEGLCPECDAEIPWGDAVILRRSQFEGLSPVEVGPGFYRLARRKFGGRDDPDG